MSEHDQDREPPSIPAVLTDEQAARVRARLDRFAKGTSVRGCAKALGYARKYVRAVRDGAIRPSVHFASRVAHVAGMDLATLLGISGGAL
ncbi:hypothetical protein [Polyangium sp. y55x31]|uniref:hypothetical protein n=1 Tax=Polyangium sp. y55x31 TaxID=3042688 RepID=UPI0024821E9A|nr:hypothetical protein [Polyangium sp. y55x31]MDI1481458.1 hypothetical protein [Polyangium sp. y55x31]